MEVNEWMAILGFAFTVLTGIGWLIFKLGELSNVLKEMKGPVSKIVPMDIKVEELWRLKTTVSNSPSVLNAHGKKILKESNIQAFTNKHFDEIITEVKGLNPKNAYETQETLIDVVRGLKAKKEHKGELEKILYNSPSDINTTLFVGAIDIRDKVIKTLNFKREDIDKNDPQKRIAER